MLDHHLTSLYINQYEWGVSCSEKPHDSFLNWFYQNAAKNSVKHFSMLNGEIFMSCRNMSVTLSVLSLSTFYILSNIWCRASYSCTVTIKCLTFTLDYVTCIVASIVSNSFSIFNQPLSYKNKSKISHLSEYRSYISYVVFFYISK